jgi:bifunctional non-homologous end joining protein LigD
VKKVGTLMQEQYPGLFTLPKKGNKTHDSQLVVIDYMQNVITRNTASVYTVRAKKDATVSTPVTWEEIENKSFKPSDFTIKTVPDRVKAKGDLFARVLELEQKLPEI